ncbi:transglutaminase-like domain-containing protein [Roseinatronobacter alkalisoli]|uniref:Transglutaminase-like domain-containing protein n=1 Tax=Roseinatronobacter alkalisoli TaxID=3028235 RepID=A0ABT5T6V0_9RHOB|nr:transglutaminase-like domain-containing protein [Roseinatronobacter sp. HJB301]MDD7970859.1 transglutaminase-like domain-containing protein [Roseinatronobacter sp. HJB301]
MTVADSFACTVTIRFDPWGYAGDDALEVLLPLPSDDGYQRILNLDAPKGQEFMDVHGHRRLIRLEHGQVATVTARIETQRLALGSYLDLPPPGSADLDEGPMTVSHPALYDLALRSLAGIANHSERISALARATADALRYQYPRDARGAATSLRRGSGDCGEYAFVFVALCRAAGIPARPVFGLITAPWMATPHAWAEAWDGDGWLPVDPNLVREGGYLGPILDTGAATRNHVGALDPYRMVLSRHTGLPWPGAVRQISSDKVEGLSLTLDGLGPVTFWHEAPHWRGKPVVPFLQMPWTVIRNPARPHFALLRRLRPWRFSIRQPSRYLPRSPFVLADIVALHPLKGVAGVVLTSLALPFLPPLAPLLQGVIWVWFGAFALGFLRGMRLMRLRSPLWSRLTAARKRNGEVK